MTTNLSLSILWGLPSQNPEILKSEPTWYEKTLRHPTIWKHVGCLCMFTLQGINISHLEKRKLIFKMPFLGDMLVPWRVCVFVWVHLSHHPKCSKKKNKQNLQCFPLGNRTCFRFHDRVTTATSTINNAAAMETNSDTAAAKVASTKRKEETQRKYLALEVVFFLVGGWINPSEKIWVK